MCLLEKWFLEFYFLFCIFSPILLNDIIDYMICLIKYDTIFTVYYSDIEEL